MMTNFFLIIILLIVLIETYVIFELIKLIKKFLGEIKSIKGIQFGTLQIGEEAPLFREIDHRNDKVILKELTQDREVILLFLSLSCITCKEIINNLHNVTPSINSYIVTIFKEDYKNILQYNEEYKNLSMIKAPYLFSNYQVTSTPYLFILNTDGKVKYYSEIKSYLQFKNLILSINIEEVI